MPPSRRGIVAGVLPACGLALVGSPEVRRQDDGHVQRLARLIGGPPGCDQGRLRAPGRLIGSRVRQHRTGRNWTLDQLAARSGVSRRMLSSIEQGSANPSIATLLRISDALGAGLPGLVDAGRPAVLRVTRAGHAPVLWQGPRGGRAALVAGTEPPEVVELWDWSLDPGESHHSEPHAAGTRELLLVLAGQVQLHVGPEACVLVPGDSAAFRGDVTHGYANPAGTGKAGQPARFALAVFEPHVGS